MKRSTARVASFAVLTLVVVSSLAACTGTAPATPTKAPPATATPSVKATAFPTSAITSPAASLPTPIVVYVTPTPAPTPVLTPAPTPTPEPSASAVPSGSPTASPTAGPAAACTGTAGHQAFFADAASKLHFDLYCASLPSSWWLQDTAYQQPNGGLFTISYTNLKGQTLTVGEGNFCAGDSTCWTSISDLGPASFGDLAGTLKLRTTDPQYAVYVGAGTANGYQIIGNGLTQAQFVAIAAGMVKIPKP